MKLCFFSLNAKTAMDGLDEFEKTLAAEKAEREKTQGREERRQRKHKHKHKHHHQDDGKDREDRHGGRRHQDDDGHRHKRSRHSREGGDDEHRPSRRYHDHRDRNSARRHHPDAPVRDAWMTAPSALEVEHVRRLERKAEPPPAQEPKRVIHARELNQAHLQNLNDGVPSPSPPRPEPPPPSIERKVDYVFGDSGSSWRMTKLRGVYTTAESSGRAVEEVAAERYGSLREFDVAREEKEEMERRVIYGSGYKEKEIPTGHLYLAREQQQQQQRQQRQQQQQQDQSSPRLEPGPSSPVIIPEEPAHAAAMDQTRLNRLRAQMMRAKLRRAPNAPRLEQEYDRAASSSLASSSSHAPPQAVVLGIMDNPQLAGPRGEAQPVNTRRGRERGLVQENTDMSLQDMVREERRTKRAPGGEGLRLAERIAKDGQYDNDLDYMDENAEKLAKRVHRSDISLKNTAVSDLQRMGRILDACPLCHHEDTRRPPSAPVVALATRVFLTLPPRPEISPGGAVIAPVSHRVNLLECDDDEWEEMRNFMKALTRMYHEQGRDVVFYENAARPRRRQHAAMVAVPIPYEQGAVAPAFFKEAFLSADDEWAQHAKVIDTAAAATAGGMGRTAFRRSIAREAPYFHAWFSLDGGLGHVVENERRWPTGDLFAREVLGGIVGAEPAVVKKQGRWRAGNGDGDGGGGDDARVEAWKKGWRKFDWTRVLGESR